MVNDKLELLFELDNYEGLPDEGKAKAIGSVTSKAKNFARAAFVIKLTEGLEGEELSNRMIELRDGKLLTRDVLRAYQQLK
jgi:hypothetical protein